jgi:hypothetical protein
MIDSLLHKTKTDSLAAIGLGMERESESPLRSPDPVACHKAQKPGEEDTNDGK